MGRINWTDEKLIDRLINNNSEKSRWDNISVLRSRPSRELFEKCRILIASKEEKIRIIGIDILAQFGKTPRRFLKKTLKIYFDLLNKTTDSKTLGSLLFAIGHNNDNLNKKQIQSVCSFVNHVTVYVKDGLVFALLGVNDLKAIETLIKLSSDKESKIRNWATFGIGTQIETDNDSVRKALWERTDDKHEETRLEAIVGLAKRKDNRVNEIIWRELRKNEFETLLFDAIIETNDSQFLPFLQQSLNLAKDDPNISPDWISCLNNTIEVLSPLK